MNMGLKVEKQKNLSQKIKTIEKKSGTSKSRKELVALDNGYFPSKFHILSPPYKIRGQIKQSSPPPSIFISTNPSHMNLCHGRMHIESIDSTKIFDYFFFFKIFVVSKILFQTLTF